MKEVIRMRDRWMCEGGGLGTGPSYARFLARGARGCSLMRTFKRISIISSPSNCSPGVPGHRSAVRVYGRMAERL